MGRLARTYPGGEIIFDAISTLASKIMNKRAEKAESDLRINLAIDEPDEVISHWSEEIEIKDHFVLGDRTESTKGWKLKTKIMNKFTNWLNTAWIIHLNFT
jgi:hypothetical protein